MLKIDDILQSFMEPRLLNQGGQKIVYQVKHSEHGLCVLKIGTYPSKNVLIRIQREVHILKEMTSHFFPKQYDFQIVDSSRFYILEEFIKGVTLDKVSEYHKEEKEIAFFLKQLLEALKLLWAKNVVHRDIKPQNIMVYDRSICVLDLGIARILDQTSLTCTFAPFGPCTPNYASPEQLENRKNQIDYRTDQFSIGIIVAQMMLEGKHPFDPNIVGKGNSIPDNIVNNIWPHQILERVCSPKMFGVISRLLGHEPYQRFRNIGEIEMIVTELMEDNS
jgi:serine/threonine-protein kinase